MAEYEDRSNYIPFTRAQIYKMIHDHGLLDAGQSKKFEQLCVILQSLYHFEFHEQAEQLKESYRPFNPDESYVPAEGELVLEGQEQLLFEKFEEILRDGNFKEISKKELDLAMEGEGLFPISLDVDFDDFETYKLYYQGESSGEAEVKGWIPFTEKTVKFDYFDRIVMLLKLKDDAYFAEKKVKKLPGTPGKIYLKYLKGVPKADLEMIFPNTKPRMKMIHKLKIGIPLAAGVGITAHKLLIAPFIMRTGKNPFEQGLSLGLVLIIGGLIAYIFKSYLSYKSTVQNFLSEITTSLYFKNMVNNQGVFTTLIDSAEEEESKEAVLAYYFLLKAGRELTEPELDDMIEDWMEKQHGTQIDFEVDDALNKLEKLKLMTRNDGGVLKVLNLDQALERLDYIWDNYFQYNV